MSSISGESFLTEPGRLVDTLRAPSQAATGAAGEARHRRRHLRCALHRALCPVAEFGLVGATMHQVDERVPVADLRDLSRIYKPVLDDFLR